MIEDPGAALMSTGEGFYPRIMQMSASLAASSFDQAMPITRKDDPARNPQKTYKHNCG